jgi:hypothetical protein
MIPIPCVESKLYLLGMGSSVRCRIRRDLLHAMQFRLPPPPQVRDRRPDQRPSPSDRDCSLDTARARSFWHADGTAGENDDVLT